MLHSALADVQAVIAASTDKRLYVMQAVIANFPVLQYVVSCQYATATFDAIANGSCGALRVTDICICSCADCALPASIQMTEL